MIVSLNPNLSTRPRFGPTAVGPTKRIAHPSTAARGCIILRVRSGTRVSRTDVVNGPAMNTDLTNALRRKSTLVYDGDCSFCRRWVARIARRDPGGTFEFVARQTDGLTKRFPKLAEGDFDTGMRLITPDGAIHVGADAAYQVARRLRTWQRIAWLYHVPGIHWLTRTVYAWVAANRQSLSGK